MARHHCTQVTLVSLSCRPLWNCTTLKWEMDGLMQVSPNCWSCKEKCFQQEIHFQNLHMLQKNLIKWLGLEYEMIHACHNDWILYWGKYKNINECPTCGESRWKVDAHFEKVHTGVPAKVPRSKRMYMYDFELL